jgi:anti-sigma factor RsiW
MGRDRAMTPEETETQEAYNKLAAHVSACDACRAEFKAGQNVTLGERLGRVCETGAALYDTARDMSTTEADRKRARLAKARREKRNASSRSRYGALRDAGMVRTPYGWE